MADKKTPAEKAKEKMEELQKSLGLNPEQSKKVYDFNLKANISMDEYEAKKPSKKLKKKQKDIWSDLRKAEYKKIFTAAQFKKYEELKKLEKDKEKAEKKELEKLKTSK
jgi:cupin superfamily acireductone dioxygenase involved in methionine salvage